MVIVRWQNDGKFVKIEEGFSVDIEGPAVWVSSNAFAQGQMFIEWRAPVPRADEQKVQELIRSVQRWAESHGYAQTQMEKDPK
jgi:hypothetical protein